MFSVLPSTDRFFLIRYNNFFKLNTSFHSCFCCLVLFASSPSVWFRFLCMFYCIKSIKWHFLIALTLNLKQFRCVKLHVAQVFMVLYAKQTNLLHRYLELNCPDKSIILSTWVPTGRKRLVKNKTLTCSCKVILLTLPIPKPRAGNEYL